MATRFTWLVNTRDHGLVQVDADICRTGGLNASASFHVYDKDGNEHTLCSFAEGNWSTVEIMSQATGYGNGFTRIEDNKAKGRGKK